MSKELWAGIESAQPEVNAFAVANNDTSACIVPTDGNWWTVPTTTDWYTLPYYPSYTYTWPAKIRLTLSEVEHLRKLAKKDAALRETLEKFAPHIDIEVDFPG